MPRPGGGGGDKKQRFVDAIVNQKLEGVRWGVANAGVAPATRLGPGEEYTSFMIAAVNGRDRSLAELIRWYERRLGQLRECLTQKHDETGQTVMHIACAHPNGAKCVEELLFAWQRVDPDRLDAGLKNAKDASGKMPIDYARGKTRDVIDEWLAEPETDEDEVLENEDGLTSTQRSKLKKKALQSDERRGAAVETSAKKEEEVKERGELPSEMPEPAWEEVTAWVDSVKKLRPICELSIDEKEGFDGHVDPALWYCESLNRLQLKLGPSLQAISGPGLAKLSHLSTLIVAGHSLTSLPDSIGQLPLKSLDASRNSIVALPENMPKTLEALDVSVNDVDSLEPIKLCDQLVTLAVDANPRLDDLSPLDFPKLKRLLNLSASSCALVSLPAQIGSLPKLETLILSDNPNLTELPPSLSSCKKLKDIKIDRAGITDNKVKGYIQKGEMKQLAKYWEKNSNGGKANKKGGKR